MRRHATFALVVLLLVGCASAPQVQRSPLETAKLAYADASLAYEAAMLSAQDARRAHLISDAQWTRVDQAQSIVQKYTPLIRSGLNLWTSTGAKPDSFDGSLSKMLGAVAEVSKVLSEVKR